jgi:hypothetical protein
VTGCLLICAFISYASTKHLWIRSLTIFYPLFWSGCDLWCATSLSIGISITLATFIILSYKICITHTIQAMSPPNVGKNFFYTNVVEFLDDKSIPSYLNCCRLFHF